MSDWQAGPGYINVRRGSKQGRAGGSHSGGVPIRKNRFLAAMKRALHATVKARAGRNAGVANWSKRI